jgi:YidC/Oxa1 family membrane protein insertase
MEKRLLLAFVLSAVIFAVWSVLFPPERPPESRPPTADALAEPVSIPVAPEERSGELVEESAAPAEESGGGLAIGGELEEAVRLSNDVMEIEISNRGAAITAFKLIGYRGDEGETLDLVQTVEHPQMALPLQLVTGEGPDKRLYAMEAGNRRVQLKWADGAGNGVEKTIVLPESGYGFDVQVFLTGGFQDAAMSVGTGMRDLGEGERNSRLARWGDAVVFRDGELEVTRRNKVKQPIVERPQVLGFVGFQDAYFLSVFRPTSGIDGVELTPLEVPDPDKGDDGKTQPVVRILVHPRGAEIRGEILGTPKEYKLLHAIGGGVEKTLDFGFFGPISVLFLKALWWIYGVVGNYGLAIILLTVGIRVLLFPLQHTSTVSMRKMQKVQPLVKEIQAKYKKKKSDPQAKAKMNQEMMALYKEQGVNPMSGCLPMFVQLPILFALYKLFLQAIELRHEPFMFWIQDLSAKDPYYITPILMTLSMWLQQRLSPQVGDPQQQRIMRMLPIVFGIMFLQFPSGLVLYWLTNNILMIVQQKVTYRLLGEHKPAAKTPPGKKGKS